MNKLRYRYFFLLVFTISNIPDYAISVTTVERINSFGYPLETYSVTTEDDALMGMSRIPHGKRFNGTIGKPVIFMGAMLSASFFYVVQNDSIAFRLADAGFDVWLPDYRAMGLSRVIIDPKTGKKRELSQIHWNYSAHELGLYDFTAAVDFVLNHTNYSKVDVVEISLGCGIVMIGLSERPEYNAKIRNNIMIAPAARNSKSIGHTILGRLFFNSVIRYIKRYKYIILGRDPDNLVFGRLCRNVLLRYNCIMGTLFLQGVYAPIDYRIIADVIAYFPQPAPSRYWVHSLQMSVSGRFQKFDYGPIENMKHYNSKIVPEYNITKVTAPTIIIYSKTDQFTALDDVKWLLNNLPNVKDSYYIHNITMSHQGFLVGKKTPTVVYPYIIKKLSEDD